MKITKSANAVLFEVKVQPRSSVNKIVGWEGETLKIKLASPPVEGKANESLISFLSNQLNVKKSSIQILKGLKSKIKLMQVKNISKDALLKIGLR